jgi:hypothetical protein
MSLFRNPDGTGFEGTGLCGTKSGKRRLPHGTVDAVPGCEF